MPYQRRLCQRSFNIGRNSLNQKEVIPENSNAFERNLFKNGYQTEIDQLEKINILHTTTLADSTSINKEQKINTMFIFDTKRNGKKK